VIIKKNSTRLFNAFHSRFYELLVHAYSLIGDFTEGFD
jgi:hypothetical protein